MTANNMLTEASATAAHAHVMLIGLGRNASDANPTRTECTWSQFVQWLYQLPRSPAGITAAEYADLKQFPSKSPEGERLHADKSGPYVVLADFGGHRRALDTLLGSCGVPLDFDAGWVTADVIAATLHGSAFIAYTTYAHQPGAERWRVFVPVSAPMDADQHRATWATLNELFGNAADGAAKDASRLSYLPGRCLFPEAARIFHANGDLFQPTPVAPAPPSVLQVQTDGPVPGWAGPADDAELIRIACDMRTRPDERFGGPVHFAMLWSANEDWLAQQYPPDSSEQGQAYSRTRADMALAGELAYWTGSDRERMGRLMLASGLARDDDDWRDRKMWRAVDEAIGSKKQWAFMQSVPAGTPPPPLTSAANVAPIPKAQHRCTDQANAERLQQRYGDKLIACAGTFYAWDGKRWKADEALPQRFACELSKIVRDEAKAVRMKMAEVQASPQVAEYIAHPRKNEAHGAELFDLEQLADGLDKWSKDCEMKSKQDAALGLLKKLLSVDVSRLDADEWLLNCENGTVDLRTGQLREHRSADFITKLAPVNYDPAAQAPRFQQFLHEIFAGDASVVDFLARWFGYAATGSVREEKLVFHWGNGSNGKTTLIETVESVLGDYATTAPPGLLTAKNADERHPAEIADLHGRRMVTASESEEGAKLREAFLKLTSGGDRLKGRRLYGQLFQFRPTHKLQLLTNHKPEIRGSDFAIWRRILLVPYTQKFGSPEQVASGDADRLGDPTLKEGLKAELPGVLAWIVNGAHQWNTRGGLRAPDVVLVASSEYRTEQDRVGEFVRDCCRLDINAWVAVGALYRSYQLWCNEAGMHPLSRRRFMNEVGRSVPGFQNQKQGGTRGVIGITLATDSSLGFGNIPLPPGATPITAVPPVVPMAPPPPMTLIAGG